MPPSKRRKTPNCHRSPVRFRSLERPGCAGFLIRFVRTTGPGVAERLPSSPAAVEGPLAALKAPDSQGPPGFTHTRVIFKQGGDNDGASGGEDGPARGGAGEEGPGSQGHSTHMPSPGGGDSAAQIEGIILSPTQTLSPLQNFTAPSCITCPSGRISDIACRCHAHLIQDRLPLIAMFVCSPRQVEEGFVNQDTNLETVKKALEARMNVIEGASWSGK